MLSDADYFPGKPRMRNEMNRKMIGHIRQCIRHEHDETSAHGLWTKLKEMYQEKTSQNKALMRRLVLKLQRGTIMAEQTSEFQRATGRGQKKRPEKRSQEGGHRGQEKRRDKKNCPRNKTQDQSSEAATTAMMAVDESDVLLAASADEESDWISDSGIAYHLCRDREWRNTQSFQGKQEKLQEKEDWKDYTDWRGVSRQEELLSNIGPVVLARRMDEESNLLHRGTQSKCRDIRRMYLKDPEWYKSARRCFGIRAKVWPDTRRCNQCKMSMEKLRGERQSRCTATGATSPKRVSFTLDK
ncbi:hypothetical protein Acr_24g0009760 [Actinidia rufa]|uniref:Uncharacterized protein n=1 Tax=Actinidia rufa TaxID=165716 RepID=A0A7J0GVH6_9ERIC|nr:hypothetical protein Acr_24g0009760 [Actinidia rufa]